MRQLGADVELVDADVERGACLGRSIGLDLHRDIGQMAQQPRQRGRLQQRFAAGDDQALLAQRGDTRGNLFLVQRELVGRAVEFDPVAVRPLVAREVPGIGGVAPHAGEIAARQPQEGAGHACTRPFALHAGEDLRLTRSLRGED